MRRVSDAGPVVSTIMADSCDCEPFAGSRNFRVLASGAVRKPGKDAIAPSG